MKKSLLLIIVALSIFSTNIKAQNNTEVEKNRIILVNPGVFYLKSLVLLSQKNIVDIPNLEYQAVFYSKSEVKMEDAQKYIDENNINFIKTVEVNGNLSPDNLYQDNSCTSSFENLFNNSKGIIFLGGWDIPPTVYGDKTNLLTQIHSPNRHYFELSFLYHLLGREGSSHKALLEKNPNYAVLGICLGMQSMSTATGGNMYQDIPSEVYGAKTVEEVLALNDNQKHRSYWKNIEIDKTLDGHSFHQIKLMPKSIFTKYVDVSTSDRPYVCSSHHQAVKKLGYGFNVIATSMDGKIIEAIQHKNYKNVLGVQFHPEFYYLHDETSKKFKIKPNDKKLKTEYEIINELGGYKFNLAYWKYFSELFK